MTRAVTPSSPRPKPSRPNVRAAVIVLVLALIAAAVAYWTPPSPLNANVVSAVVLGAALSVVVWPLILGGLVGGIAYAITRRRSPLMRRVIVVAAVLACIAQIVSIRGGHERRIRAAATKAAELARVADLRGIMRRMEAAKLDAAHAGDADLERANLEKTVLELESLARRDPELAQAPAVIFRLNLRLADAGRDMHAAERAFVEAGGSDPATLKDPADIAARLALLTVAEQAYRDYLAMLRDWPVMLRAELTRAGVAEPAIDKALRDLSEILADAPVWARFFECSVELMALSRSSFERLARYDGRWIVENGAVVLDDDVPDAEVKACESEQARSAALIQEREALRARVIEAAR